MNKNFEMFKLCASIPNHIISLQMYAQFHLKATFSKQGAHHYVDLKMMCCRHSGSIEKQKNAALSGAKKCIDY